jgi:hypothetical protein
MLPGDMAKALKEELTSKYATSNKITSPSPNTTYYSDWVDLSERGSTGFLIYSDAGDPLTVQVELNDGEYSGDLAGYAISSTNYQVGKWNSMLIPEFSCIGGKVRLRITTGAVAPGVIKVVSFRRGM